MIFWTTRVSLGCKRRVASCSLSPVFKHPPNQQGREASATRKNARVLKAMPQGFTKPLTTGFKPDHQPLGDAISTTSPTQGDCWSRLIPLQINRMTAWLCLDFLDNKSFSWLQVQSRFTHFFFCFQSSTVGLANIQNKRIPGL